MFIDNVDIFAYMQQAKFVPGYRNWEISRNIHSIRSAFKKMITRSDEIPYKNSIRNITREDLSRAMDLFDAHVASRGKLPFEIKLRYLSRHGSNIYMLVKAAITKWDEYGEPTCMKGCNMDITNFVVRKNELIQQNEKYDMILEGINAGVWERNLKTGFEWWSDKFYELLGYRPGEIKASYHNFREYLVHPADLEIMNAAIDAHLEQRASYLVEIRLLHKDGNYYWFETAGKAKFSDDGTAEKMVGSIINRHNKRMLEQELEKNQFLFGEAGRIIKTGGWQFRFGSDCAAWTKQIFEIYEIEEGRQPSVDESINYYHGESKKVIRHAFENLLAFDEPYDLELQFVTAKGNKKWVRTTVNLLKDNFGKTIAAGGILQDITGQKERELELRKINDVNIEQNERLSNFAHIVTHNLHSHAGNISSLVNLLEAAQTPSEKDEVMRYMKKMCASLNNTISELRDLVKTRHNTAPSRADVYFETVFNNVLDILQPTIKKTKATIESSFQGCPLVSYVPAYIESILLNLISNAVKYRHPQRAPHITVKTYSNNHNYFLTVTDNGKGIDLEKNHEQIFGMYKTFDQQPESNGIGLFITRNQVQSMGGNIYVCSTPGEGTTFTVQF